MYSKTANNRTPVANNEYTGGPGSPGTGFCGPGSGAFNLSSSSGLPLTSTTPYSLNGLFIAILNSFNRLY